MSQIRRMMMGASSSKGGGGGIYDGLEGVYIEDIDGNLYTPNEWDPTRVPNGIAIFDKTRFVVSLDIIVYGPMVQYGGFGMLVGSSPETDIALARSRYDGYNSTKILLSKLGTGESTAAGYCYSYTFPNGKRGYLGSLGEYYIIGKYAERICYICYDVLNIGPPLDGPVCTSTQYSEYSVWGAYFSGGSEIEETQEDKDADVFAFPLTSLMFEDVKDPFDFEDLPAESTSFGFPLYLNVIEFGYEDERCIFYKRTPDEVSQQLYQWMMENIYVSSGGEVQLPVSIYINGVLAIGAVYQGDNYAIYGEFEHLNEVLVYYDGTIEGVIYK